MSGCAELLLKVCAISIIILNGQTKWIQALPPNGRHHLKEARPRLSLADWNNYNYFEPEGPGTYAFGYELEDPETNNIQYRNEERHANGTVTGSYGFVDPQGNVHVVNYIADHLGYRARVETKKGQLKPDILNDALTADEFSEPNPMLPFDNPKFHDEPFHEFLPNLRIVTPNYPQQPFQQNNWQQPSPQQTLDFQQVSQQQQQLPSNPLPYPTIPQNPNSNLVPTWHSGGARTMPKNTLFYIRDPKRYFLKFK